MAHSSHNAAGGEEARSLHLGLCARILACLFCFRRCKLKALWIITGQGLASDRRFQASGMFDEITALDRPF